MAILHLRWPNNVFCDLVKLLDTKRSSSLPWVLGALNTLKHIQKLFHQVNLLSVHQPGMWLWHPGHWPCKSYHFFTNSSCHPITCSPQYATSYFRSHLSLMWFLTNTLSPAWNSSTGYVRNCFSSLSLNNVIWWMANAYISLRTCRAEDLIICQIFNFCIQQPY